jgi:hypothetical protein
MKLRIGAAALLLSLAVSSQLSAFDGQRKGFILGVGFGAGGLNYDGRSVSFNNVTFENNFKIGYAPSNSFEIYYANIVSYFETLGTSFASGAACIAVTKYLKPEGRGLYFCGGVGFGYFWETEWDTIDESGFGTFGGIGYDIGKHWSVQAEVVYTNLEPNSRSWGFRVTLNTLAF